MFFFPLYLYHIPSHNFLEILAFSCFCGKRKKIVLSNTLPEFVIFKNSALLFSVYFSRSRSLAIRGRTFFLTALFILSVLRRGPFSHHPIFSFSQIFYFSSFFLVSVYTRRKKGADPQNSSIQPRHSTESFQRGPREKKNVKNRDFNYLNQFFFNLRDFQIEKKNCVQNLRKIVSKSIHRKLIFQNDIFSSFNFKIFA